jgi:hypothetical protein
VRDSGGSAADALRISVAELLQCYPGLNVK